MQFSTAAPPCCDTLATLSFERDIHPVRWQAKYDCTEVSDARRLKILEAGNAKLNKMPAERMHSIVTLKHSLRNNFERPRFQITQRLFGSRKCIRPLIIRLIFKPDLDEIRASGSRLLVPGSNLVFIHG